MLLLKKETNYKGMVLSFKAQTHMLRITVVTHRFTAATPSLPRFWIKVVENK